MEASAVDHHTLGLQAPLLRNRTGRGVRIAVLDSGVNPENPHVGAVTSGGSVVQGRGSTGDVTDRLGHGTAVVAAIQEKAPEARVQVIKVFDRALGTEVDTLIRAIDRATEGTPRLINLSLGCADDSRADELRVACDRACAAGALVVSPREHRGRRWWPGSLPGVVGVLLDWGCPRDELRLVRGPSGRPVFRASGLPRPIPGVPPSRNLKGISFAAANVTGLLARLLEARPELRSADQVAGAVEEGEDPSNG